MDSLRERLDVLRIQAGRRLSSAVIKKRQENACT